MEMFGKTQELNEVILLINGIDSTKFAKFLNRFVEKIDEKPDNIYSEEEKVKLKTILGINDMKNIDLVIKTIHSLFRRIVYNITKPKVLTKELTELGLETDKVVIFVELWNNCASDLIDKLKDKSFELSANRLSAINWTIKLLSQQNMSSAPNPVPLAQIDLTLKSANHSNSNISIDLDRKELWNLFECLEEIQSQLDSLHK